MKKIINTVLHHFRGIATRIVKRINPDFNPKYTSDYEVGILAYLAKQERGDILEIGCNEGATSVYLADATTYKVVGLDCSSKVTKFTQDYERPDKSRIGWKARKKGNFYVLDVDSSTAESKLRNYNFKMVFIDGDHTYEGVKKDTEMMMKLMTSGSLFVWHDFNPNGPHWIGVYKYLSNQPYFNEIHHIQGTTLAVYRKQ